MKLIETLKIDKPIAVMAGGQSSYDLTQDDIKLIKDKFFSIGINDFFHFTPDARFWYDYTVTDQLMDYYLTRYKDCIFISRSKAFAAEQKTKFLYSLIDYWFNREKDKFEGSFTIIVLLQLLLKYNPEQNIYLFGVDCKGDRRTYKSGKVEIEKRKGYNEVLDKVKSELESKFGNNKKIYNCNQNADIKMQKINFKDVL